MFGGNDAKKKMVGVFVCMLILTTTFSVMAGDEINPEITDNEGDARNHLDIISAWFYEKMEKPDYLYIIIKICSYNLDINEYFWNIKPGTYSYRFLRYS